VTRHLLAAAALLIALTGCKVDRRSEGYTCETETDCGAGRTCDQGWCVEVGGGDGDADPNAPDADPNAPDADPNAPDSGPDAAFVCPEGCSSCDEDDTCIITCAGASSCAEQVVCPAGVKCKVECAGAGSCAAGVDCTAATRCEIECGPGDDACGGLLECGEGLCLVECSSTGSCALGTSCEDSCQCRTQCADDACATASTCPPDPNCTQGGECKDTHPDCLNCSG
jgi:hypothetical protein